MGYKNIIFSSTDHFKKRHLILDEEKRIKIKKICKTKLGSERAFTISKAHRSDTFSMDVYDACEWFAKERFDDLANDGFYRTNQSGQGSSRKNTMIISGTILLHIKQAHRGNGYLRFEIRKITSLEERLVRKIAHFNDNCSF